MTYTYNADGTLATRVDGRGVITTISRDPVDSRVTGMTYSDGVTPSVSSGFTFDGEERLTAISGKNFAASYSGDGTRATKTVMSDSPAQTYYLYDEASGNPSPLIEEGDPSGTVSVLNAYGRGPDGLRARFTGGGSGFYYNYTFDPMGNFASRQTSAAAAGDRTGIDEAEFDAYGTKTGDYSVSTGAATAGDGIVGYGGEWGNTTDYETGLLSLGHRYYDPGTGHFLTRDPIDYRGGENLYDYAGNNPVNEMDPGGDNPWHPGEPDFGVFGGQDILQPTSNFFSGWGDTLAIGGTKIARQYVGNALGIGDANKAVDYDSGAYHWGEVAGTAHTIAFGVAGGLKAAGAKAAGKEFSHWIPNRTLKAVSSRLKLNSVSRQFVERTFGRSKLNGNYVTTYRHYLQDPYRFPSEWRNFGPRLNSVLQQIDRVPRTIYGSVDGLGWGAGYSVLGKEHSMAER